MPALLFIDASRSVPVKCAARISLMPACGEVDVSSERRERRENRAAMLFIIRYIICHGGLKEANNQNREQFRGLAEMS